MHALNKTLVEEMLIKIKYTELLVESLKASYLHFVQQRHPSTETMQDPSYVKENKNTARIKP
jgi:hypothetical protein